MNSQCKWSTGKTRLRYNYNSLTETSKSCSLALSLTNGQMPWILSDGQFQSQPRKKTRGRDWLCDGGAGKVRNDD